MIVHEPSRRGRGRIVAVAVAVALVVGAVAVRRLVIDDDPERGAGAGDGDGQPVLVCIEELAAACDAFAGETRVEPAGDTAATLLALAEGEEPPFDAWLTVAPWSGIVRDERARAEAGPVLGDDEPLARSLLAVAARADRAAVLTAHCREVTWTCIGDVAGGAWSQLGGDETWGRVRPAHADPRSTAEGLLAVGHAAGTFLATPEIPPDDVSRIDWETDDAFPGWFQQLERAIPEDTFAPGADPFARWLQTRFASADLVATTAARASSSLASAAADLRDGVTLLYPAPVASADVVLVRVPGGARVEAGALTEALAAAGFVIGDGAPDTDPPLPPTDGLPAPGTLAALQDLWSEVTR